MNHQDAEKIRVRFAPSPTGYLHIGGVRTAIFNWLYARHTGGTFLLRVEDTDLQRSKKEFLDSQLKSLEWLGLRSDAPIVYQMERVKEYARSAQDLMKKGLAYPCFCAPRDADKVVADLERGVVNKYPGTCRDKEWCEKDLEKPYAIRFKLPAQHRDGIEFTDLIRGKVRVNGDQLDDMVIVRRDGSPTYNFCVVIDDIFMKITHVIRGEDHLTNTAKQLLFYQTLGETPPHFAHLPLILSKSGGKMSKRDTAVSVDQYRRDGFMPDALLNYLVRLGWSHGDQEVFTKQEIIDFFTLEAVGKKGSIFDLQKLEWLNGVYIRNANFNKLLLAIQEMDPKIYLQLNSTWSISQLEKLINQYKERSVTLRGLCNDILALASDPEDLDVNLIAKWYGESTGPMIASFAAELEKKSLLELEKKSLLELAKQVSKKYGEKLVTIAQPLRLALTGKVQSPGVFDLIGILGKERVVKRIKVLLGVIKNGVKNE